MMRGVYPSVIGCWVPTITDNVIRVYLILKCPIVASYQMKMVFSSIFTLVRFQIQTT